MKKITFLLLCGLLFLSWQAFNAFDASNDETDQISQLAAYAQTDVVHDIRPVEPLARAMEMYKIEPGKRLEWLVQTEPTLPVDMMRKAINSRQISCDNLQCVDRFGVTIGSSLAETFDGFGQVHKGNFKDEPVGLIYFKESKYPVAVQVACANGNLRVIDFEPTPQEFAFNTIQDYQITGHKTDFAEDLRAIELMRENTQAFASNVSQSSSGGMVMWEWTVTDEMREEVLSLVDVDHTSPLYELPQVQLDWSVIQTPAISQVGTTQNDFHFSLFDDEAVMDIVPSVLEMQHAYTPALSTGQDFAMTNVGQTTTHMNVSFAENTAPPGGQLVMLQRQGFILPRRHYGGSLWSPFFC